MIHIVEAGETAAQIAARYGVSVERVIADNGLAYDLPLAVGQALVILMPAQVYTVQAGDTLSNIAANTGTSVLRLLQLNPALTERNTLLVGEQLTVRLNRSPNGIFSVLGYAYPFIESAVLNRALPFLTYLAVFSYGFSDDGSILTVNDAELISAAYQYGTVPLMVLTAIDETGRFSSEKVSRVLNDPDFRQTVLENLIEQMLTRGYGGLDVDFEYIPPTDEAAFLDFLEVAAELLHANGLILTVALAPKTSADQRGLLYEAHNYPAIGQIADLVFLMTYEWGYSYGPPMAVAPLNRVRQVALYAQSSVPANKIQLGIPNYGYDWPLPFVQGTTRARSIGNEEAVTIAAQNRAEILFDETAASPYFYYTKDGTEHAVWFEDARSVAQKFELANELGFIGIGYWNLMRPFRQNWALLSARYTVRKNQTALLDKQTE